MKGLYTPKKKHRKMRKNAKDNETENQVILLRKAIMEEQETASKEKTNLADKIYVDFLWLEVASSMIYFESLKVRDIIVGRLALLLLLSLSIVTISIPGMADPWWGKIIIAVFTVFPTVALYWVGKNGYFLSISSLFHMILHKELTIPQMHHGIAKNKAECIDEQRALLESYVADCPKLSLLLVLHGNRARKSINDDYRRLADSPCFREQLKVSRWKYFLAHFFTCQMIANKKIHTMRVIQDEVDKKEAAKKKKPSPRTPPSSQKTQKQTKEQNKSK